MARILPWVTGAAAPAKASNVNPKPKPKPRATPRTKRERSEDSSIDVMKVRENDGDSSSPATPVRRKRAQSRTPSASPPPGPPEVQYSIADTQYREEANQEYRLMRDGYDADDIYIMVEDEFQSVAQSFTHHLHHAEYKRLQRKARETPPKRAPKLLPTMSTGIRQKLEAKKLRERQSRALNEMVNDIQSKNSRDEADVEDQVDDPWSGTHLASLMTSESQQNTALVGLEKIPSSTRASKGFGRGEGDSPRKCKHPKSNVAIVSGNKEKDRQIFPDASPDPNEDDLDLPWTSKSFSSNGSSHSNKFRTRSSRQDFSVPVKPESKELSSPSTAAKQAVTGKFSHLGSKTKRAIPFFDDGFDDLKEHRFEEQETAHKPKMDSPEKRRRAKEREKEARASEIPTFLV